MKSLNVLETVLLNGIGMRILLGIILGAPICSVALPFVTLLRHEKTCFLHMQKNKDTHQLSGNCGTDHCLCFRYIDSAIPLLSKSEISSL